MDKAYFGLLGAMLGAFIALAGTWWRERQAKHERAHYLAVRITIILDDLIWKLAYVAQDDGYLNEPRECAEGRTTVPDTPQFTQDLDWKSIDPRLAYRILMIPVRFERADEAVNFAAEHAALPSYEEMFDERQKQYALLGLEMDEVTRELRNRFRVAERENGHWDPVAVFTEVIAELERKQAEYVAENSRMWDELQKASETRN